MGTAVKICGLKEPDHIAAAADAGARYIGFVFFEKSPRHVTPDVARQLALDVPPGVAKVALTVNADDRALAEITDKVPLDMLQLHGSETPERVAEVKARFGLPVMKAVGVQDADDIAGLSAFESVADQILVDAKPPKNAVLPGGNGLTFDWRLISTRRWPKPWMLAGGLTPENVAEAVALTGAAQVDVSTGVEAGRGEKDMDLIVDFLRAAKAG